MRSGGHVGPRHTVVDMLDLDTRWWTCWIQTVVDMLDPDTRWGDMLDTRRWFDIQLGLGGIGEGEGPTCTVDMMDWFGDYCFKASSLTFGSCHFGFWHPAEDNDQMWTRGWSVF